MHLCFDASAALRQQAGIGRYGRELINHLRPQLGGDKLSVFTNNARDMHFPPTFKDLLCYRTPLNNKAWRVRVAADYLLGRGLDREFVGVDLFFAADHLLPRFRHIPSIININDLSFLLQPDYHTLFSRTYQRALMPHWMRHAAHITVPSEATRRDLETHYTVAAARISVIPDGVDDRFRVPLADAERQAVRQRYDLHKPFILYVGTLEPRKNVRGLVDAFGALIADGAFPTLDLVLAGGLGWRYESTLTYIEQLGLGTRVRRLGHVPDTDLPALYGAADLFAFPSWYEGFGLPPLEAMASGTPVVVSNAASLPEVVGDAGLLVAPDDTAQLVGALRSVLEQPALRERLRHAGRVQAAQFTWDKTAQATLTVCHEVVHAHRA